MKFNKIIKPIGKKGLFDSLSSEALQFLMFIFFLIMGTILIVSLGAGASNCVTGVTWNQSSGVCTNNTNSSITYGNGGVASGIAWSLQAFFGTTNGGFGSWSGSIITLVIAVIFIGALMGLMRIGGNKSRM